uniref:Uncharacterized protein n=1 Tax=Rhizophora mucronata TaxID=61149 RepID=A0A2P2JQ46_RHIMU
MRFILSYASNAVSSEKSDLWNRQLVEPCVRNLLNEFVQQSHNIPRASVVGLVQNQFPDTYGQTQRSAVYNVEMKRGDWICLRWTPFISISSVSASNFLSHYSTSATLC